VAVIAPSGVVTTIPAPGDNNVALGQPITITFNRTMNKAATQQAFAISPAPKNLSYSWSADSKTMTVTHDNFQYRTSYTCTVSTKAQDIGGVSLAGPYSWQFSAFPLVHDVYAEPPYFTPAGTLYPAGTRAGQSRTAIHYTLKETATVTIEIRGLGNALVHPPENLVNLARNTGEHSESWAGTTGICSGMFCSATPCPAGVYDLKVIATTQQGQTGQDTGSVTIDDIPRAEITQIVNSTGKSSGGYPVQLTVIGTTSDKNLYEWRLEYATGPDTWIEVCHSGMPKSNQQLCNSKWVAYGRHKFRLTVIDKAGNSAESVKEVTVWGPSSGSGA